MTADLWISASSSDSIRKDWLGYEPTFSWGLPDASDVLESEFCQNFTCCGIFISNLHDLQVHREDCYHFQQETDSDFDEAGSFCCEEDISLDMEFKALRSRRLDLPEISVPLADVCDENPAFLTSPFEQFTHKAIRNLQCDIWLSHFLTPPTSPSPKCVISLDTSLPTIDIKALSLDNIVTLIDNSSVPGKSTTEESSVPLSPPRSVPTDDEDDSSPPSKLLKSSISSDVSDSKTKEKPPRLTTLSTMNPETGIREYVCRTCRKQYKNGNGLKYHLTHVHRNGAPIQPPRKTGRTRISSPSSSCEDHNSLHLEFEDDLIKDEGSEAFLEHDLEHMVFSDTFKSFLPEYFGANGMTEEPINMVGIEAVVAIPAPLTTVISPTPESQSDVPSSDSTPASKDSTSRPQKAVKSPAKSKKFGFCSSVSFGIRATNQTDVPAPLSGIVLKKSKVAEGDKAYICPLPECLKAYKNLNGLKYHFERIHLAPHLSAMTGEMPQEPQQNDDEECPIEFSSEFSADVSDVLQEELEVLI